MLKIAIALGLLSSAAAFAACGTTVGLCANGACDGALDGSVAPDGSVTDGGLAPDTYVPPGCNAASPRATPDACMNNASAVYVAATGSATGDGTKANPFKTVQAGLDKAKGLGVNAPVFVCGSGFTENLTASGAVSVYGGFECPAAPGGSWTANDGATSKVTANSVGYTLDVAANANVVFQDFELVALAGTASNVNSITTRVVNATAKFTRVTFTAGPGLPGISRTQPSPPAQTSSGSGQSGPSCTCAAGADGLTQTSGGGGGNANALGAGGGPASVAAASPQDGVPGTVAACAGGGNGHEGGTSTKVGANASALAASGVLVANQWVPQSGGNGGHGGLGQGGGGGYGNGGGIGGGGGCGGCGGEGGLGGSGGGTSAGVLSIDAVAVSLVDCTVTTADGGKGGDGALGAVGGDPGAPANGTGGACRGGYGGYGAGGGAGGGGAGGHSVAVLYKGTAATLNAGTKVTTGLKGVGGQGGGTAPKGPDGSTGPSAVIP